VQSVSYTWSLFTYNGPHIQLCTSLCLDAYRFSLLCSLCHWETSHWFM